VLGIELAKEWGNRPANHATPTLLGEAAKGLAKLPRIKCEVLGPKEVEKLGMGSFAAVAQGSAEPLRFIVLRYQGAAKDQAPVVLVGKGITFDTGGVSLKPAAEMDEMKFDMCGAASVLGTFRALGEIQPAINVVGLIPSCENMNDGRSVKPGDVVTSMSGQTIEVLNTDAEGRLILCDALTYAKRFDPAAVIDIATLTGACVVALGGVRSGLFSSDETLARASSGWRNIAGPLLAPAAGRRLRRGPEEQFRRRGEHRGPCRRCHHRRQVPAALCRRFPWAHLDIAGTAWKSGAAKGSTGRPVGLLVSYLTSRAANGAAADKPAKSASSVKSTKASPKTSEAPARKARSAK
jgi:leucyl aminopeptidase